MTEEEPKAAEDLPQSAGQQSGSLQSPIVRFLLGAVLGSAFPLVYLSYVWYFGSDVTASQLWFLGALALSSGGGGVIWGTKLLASLMQILENMPGF